MKNLNKLRELMEKATPGPWSSDDGQYSSTIFENGFSMGAGFRKREDAKLIVAVRNCLPELLAVVEASTHSQKAMRDQGFFLPDVDKALSVLDKKLGEL